MGIANVILLVQAIFIAYFKKYKFDITDISIFAAYSYFIIINGYNSTLFSNSVSFTVQLFFILYFAYCIIFYYFNPKHIFICLLAVYAIFQSLIGIAQLLSILESRHTLFPITGNFLNPGPLGCFLAIIGVTMVLHITTNYSFFIKCQQKDDQYNENTFFFQTSYYLSIVASILIIITLTLLESRSAWLGLVIPIMIFILTRKSTWNMINNLKYKKTLLLIGTLTTLIIASKIYYIRPESANGRLHIWQVSLYEFNSSMITGTGIGTFPKQYIVAQEKFYRKNGTKSNWIRYADTPLYAFNEYLNIVYETGIIGLLFFIFILFLVIKKQLSSNNLIFAYGIISILTTSFTSYPLHLIPTSIILITLISIKGSNKEGIISSRFTLFILLFVLIFTALQVPNYITTINATSKWEKMKYYSEISIIEPRKNNDFLELYNFLSGNDRFLLDYATFLKKKKNYSKSIDIPIGGIKLAHI